MKWYNFVLMVFISVNALLIACSNNIDSSDQYEGKNKDFLVETINNKLHLNISPKDIQSISYTELLVNDEFKYPYTVYSKINCDSSVVKDIIAKLKLNSNKDSLIGECSEEFLKFFGQEYWKTTTYNARYTSSMYDKERKIKWWKPGNKNLNYYGFANDTIKTIPISCDGNWNGRVVLQRTAEGCFLLIDYIM